MRSFLPTGSKELLKTEFWIWYSIFFLLQPELRGVQAELKTETNASDDDQNPNDAGTERKGVKREHQEDVDDPEAVSESSGPPSNKSVKKATNWKELRQQVSSCG